MTLLSVFANSYAADGTYAGWTNPANVYADDGVYAARVGTVKNTTYGNLYGFDLSGIPDGATINSVTLSAEWHNSADDTNGPKLILGVKTGGSSPGNATDITGQTADEVHVYAPTGLTATQLKATGDLGFWAILRFYRTDNVAHIAYLDYVKIEIDYTAGGLAEITGAADITLDAFGQTADGAVAVSGTGAITLAGLTADITGTVQEQDAITASASMTLDGMSASGSGVVTVSGELSNTFSSMSMDATGLIEVTGSASKALDGLTGEIIGVVGNAPVVGLLEGLFSGMICQMVGVVTVSGTGGVVLDTLTCNGAGTVADVTTLPISPRKVICRASERKVRVTSSERTVQGREEDRTFFISIDDRNFFIGD